MRTYSGGLVTFILGVVVLLFLTVPRPSIADPYWHGEGARERNWGALQHERSERDQAYAAQQREWERLQHERHEMHEARWAGDWQAYQHERREAEQAAEALHSDQAHIAHEQRELWLQQGGVHPHRDWENE